MGTHESVGLPIVLRCFAYPDRERDGRWIAHCIDIDVMAAGDSLNDARSALHEAIDLFLESVSELDDKDAVLELLSRKAPLRTRARWRIQRWISTWRDSDPDGHSTAFIEPHPCVGHAAPVA